MLNMCLHDNDGSIMNSLSPRPTLGQTTGLTRCQLISDSITNLDNHITQLSRHSFLQFIGLSNYCTDVFYIY